MRKNFNSIVAVCVTVAFVVAACKKDTKQTTSDIISPETLSKIEKLGFSTTDVQKMEEGYLVEGDIILSEANLNETRNEPTLRIANEEQYRTNNLVTSLPRTISVSVSGTINASFSVAVDSAIRRYNQQGLSLQFSRVQSGGAIDIRIVNTGQYIASSGFPSGGNPYNQIKYAKKYTSYSIPFMTTVLTHEMGHCIGFRHTDYMNRSYSCGIGGDEGDGGVGAVYIQGTAAGPEPGSWMLACLSSTSNRPFTTNDVTALKYLYK